MAENSMTPTSRKRSREDKEQGTLSKRARLDSDARLTTADPHATADTTEGSSCDKANTTSNPPRETSEVQTAGQSAPGSTNGDKVKLPKQHRDDSLDSLFPDEEDTVPETSVKIKVTSKKANNKVKLDPRRVTLQKLATPEELPELDTEEGIDRLTQKYLAIAHRTSAPASKKRKIDDEADSSSVELGRAAKKQRAAKGSVAQGLPQSRKSQAPPSKTSKKPQTPRTSSTTSPASTTSSLPSSASNASTKPARKGLTTLQEAHQRVQAEQAEKEAEEEKETVGPEVSKDKVLEADNAGSHYRNVTNTQQQLRPATSVPAPAAVPASGRHVKKQPYLPVKKKWDFYAKRVPLTAEQLTKADLKRAGDRLTRPTREPTAYSRKQAAERRKQLNEALLPESKRREPLSSASVSSTQKPLLAAKTERKVRQESLASDTDDESIENRPTTAPARPALARKESASSIGSQTSSSGAFKKPDSRLEALRRKYRGSMSDDNVPSRRSS